jgi:hypothetical protein
MRSGLLELKEGGAAFKKRVSNPRVFKAYMLVKAPVLGVTGAYLDEIGTHAARLVVPYGRAAKNLFGNMFASAVLAGAETASASMIVLHTRNQGGKLTAELKKVSMESHASPTDDVRVIADDGAAYADFVRRAIDSGEPIEETFTVTVVDSAGETTHRVELTWELHEK